MQVKQQVAVVEKHVVRLPELVGIDREAGGHPRSRKGLLAKGYKTRNPKKTTSKFIISRKKK